MSSPPTKRAKTDDALSILAPHILESENDLRQAYVGAKPYAHGRMENMFNKGFLDQVFKEIGENSKLKFKESDLFRVYQSIDLGNLDASASENQKNLPHLLQLKAALYSPDYRAFIESVTNLEPNTLTEQVDCAANCHAPGCHLLCHDDVIGTRKVSYIIYLTDKGWEKKEGGALELYDHDEVENGKRVPQAIPCKTILPAFNSMAYFVVQPGTSFHAVQEVFGERPRLSIQGWYHAAVVPEGMEDATLSRLKSTEKGEDTEGDFTAYGENGAEEIKEEEDEVVMLQEDRDFLTNYINETYLSLTSMKEIRKRFEEDSSVQLRQFLNKSWMDKLNGATKKEDANMGDGKPAVSYDQAVTNGWDLVGPAHKQRFLEYTGDSKGEDAGSVLMHLRTEVFQSPPFGRFLKSISGLGMPLGHRGRVRRFRPGLDYTVAHYGILTTEAVLDASLCLCAGNGEQCRVDEETGDLIGSDEDAVWASGDCGGFECYIEADDEDEAGEEAADEYNGDDDTELLSVSASNNTLSLVYRDPGTMRFVKYVGCRAPSSRWDISMEYEVKDDGEDGNEEGEGDDEEDEPDAEDDDGNE